MNSVKYMSCTVYGQARHPVLHGERYMDSTLAFRGASTLSQYLTRLQRDPVDDSGLAPYTRQSPHVPIKVPTPTA